MQIAYYFFLSQPDVRVMLVSKSVNEGKGYILRCLASTKKSSHPNFSEPEQETVKKKFWLYLKKVFGSLNESDI